MKLDNIRLIFLNMIDDLPGHRLRSKTMLAFKKGRQHMLRHVCIIADPNSRNSFRRLSSSIYDLAGMPGIMQCIGKFHGDLADASVAADCIDL